MHGYVLILVKHEMELLTISVTRLKRDKQS
jgi:hypothetical protein